MAGQLAVITEALGPLTRPRTSVTQHGLGLVLVLGVAALTFLPVLVVVLGSFEGDNWQLVLFESGQSHSALGYSVLFALRAPFAVALGFFIAWVLIRMDIPGSSAIEFLFWLAFFLPLIPITLGWMLLLDGHDGLINQALKVLPFIDESVFDINSIAGIFWVHLTASSVPVMIILLGPAIRQLDASLEDAGRVCGSKPLQVFRRITLPLLLPATLTGTILGFIRGMEAFEVEQLLGVPAKIFVYSTRVYALINWEPPKFNEAMALSTLVLVFLLAIALGYQYVTRRGSHATILGAGMSRGRIRLGRLRYVISGALFLFLGVAVLMPLAFLLLGSFMTLFGFFGIDEPYTIRHWTTVLNDRNFLPAVRNSLVLSLGAGFVGTLVYAALAYLFVRTRIPYRALASFLTWLPWCIPGILLGVGLLTLVLFNPVLNLFYGSIGILVAAIVISQFPLGINLMRASLGQLSRELEYASQICGAGRITTFRRIVLPLMRPTLVSIFILVLIVGLRDVSTVLLLAQPRSLPLSVLMLEYANAGGMEPAAVVGIITSILIIAIAVLARRFGIEVGHSR